MTAHRRTAVRRLAAGVAALAATALIGATLPAPAGAATSPTPRRIMSGWGYFSSTSSSALTSLQANADLFTDISPFWYTATWNGSASAVTPASYAANRATVLPAIQKTGVAVLPTVTDGMAPRRMAAVLTGATTRAALVNQLVSTVTTEGYQGIDLDFESFAFADGQSTWSTTRPAWVTFVNQLATALHARGKLLSVTTPPLYSATSGYWVYDWAGISAAVDRLRVMTYDYSTSTAGPIAPFAWVQKVAAFAVTQVAPGKVQIGVPTYGRDWVTGTTYTGVTGQCPTEPPAGANPTQVSTFSDALAYATVRHTITTAGMASYLAYFSGPAFTAPGISLLTAPAPAWNATYQERSFSTKIAFSGTHDQAVTTTGTAPLASKTVTVASTAGIVVGLTATATGIPAGAKVSAIDPTGKVVTLSTPTSGALAATSIRFSGPAPASCTVSRLGYYEDASSAVARATLVATYHLRGIAEWTIGGEDPTQWTKLRSYATTIAPTPTSVVVTAPSLVTAGAVIRVNATAVSAGLPVAGATAVLSRKRTGTTTWQVVASTTTSATGTASFALNIGAPTDYRVTVSGTFDRAAGAGGVTTQVRSAVVLSVNGQAVRWAQTVAVPVGRTVTVGVTAWPHMYRQQVLRQVWAGGRWTTVAISYTTSAGTASFAWKPAVRTTSLQRVVAVGMAGVVTGATPFYVKAS